MPRKRTAESIRCTHFTWLLSRRGRVWQADGRSGNTAAAGRHSLGTPDRDEALRRLGQLDVQVAVRLGQAPQSALPATTAGDELTIAEGVRLYLEHVGRAPTLGGAGEATKKRYRAVFDKFRKFCRVRGIQSWQQVTQKSVDDYVSQLDRQDYKPRSQYLEQSTLVQCVGHLVRQKHLPLEQSLRLSVVRQVESTTFCYSDAEVDAILDACRAEPKLDWLGDVVVALSRTGMRIGELAQLCWADVDESLGQLTVRHERASARPSERAAARSVKGRRSRRVSIHADLRAVLARLRQAGVEPRQPVFRDERGQPLDSDRVRRVLVNEVLLPLEKTLPPRSDGRRLGEGRVHSFRHYFVSHCANQGVAQQTLMQWVGHRDSQMIRHYYHLRDEQSAAVMATLTFSAEPASRDQQTPAASPGLA